MSHAPKPSAEPTIARVSAPARRGANVVDLAEWRERRQVLADVQATRATLLATARPAPIDRLAHAMRWCDEFIKSRTLSPKGSST